MARIKCDTAFSLPFFVFIITCILINKVFVYAIYNLITYGNALTGLGIIVLVSLSGVFISYDSLPRAVRIVVRVTLSFSVFYIVASRMYLPGDVINDQIGSGIIVNYLWIPAAIFGALSLIRPSLGIVPLHYMILQKLSLVAVFGIPITAVDYITVIDTCGLIIMGIILYPLFARLQSYSKILSRGFDISQLPIGKNLHLLEGIFLAAIALHFGNYFYGAIGKMSVGENLVHWIYGNETEYLFLASMEVGVNPLSFSDELTKLAYELFSQPHGYSTWQHIPGN